MVLMFYFICMEVLNSQSVSKHWCVVQVCLFNFFIYRYWWVCRPRTAGGRALFSGLCQYAGFIPLCGPEWTGPWWPSSNKHRAHSPCIFNACWLCTWIWCWTFWKLRGYRWMCNKQWRLLSHMSEHTWRSTLPLPPWFYAWKWLEDLYRFLKVQIYLLFIWVWCFVFCPKWGTWLESVWEQIAEDSILT